MMLIHEFRKLYCRKPFLLLSAVLLLFQLFSLFLIERNTDTYYYLYQQKTVYQEALQDPDSSAEFYQKRIQQKEAYFQEYNTFLSGMNARVQQIRKNGFQGTAKEQAYQEKVLQKTLRDYEVLQDVTLSDAELTSFEKYVSSNVSVIFELLFILLLFYYGFAEEKEKGIYQLLRSGQFGRGRLSSTKLTVFLLVSASFTMLSEFSVLLFFCTLYGISDPEAAVQSVPVFRNCAFLLTVRQLVIRAMLLRMLLMQLLSAFMYSLGAFFHRTLGSVLFFFLFSGFEYLVWQTTKTTDSLRGIHYVNLISLANPVETFGEYTLLRLGNTPVNAVDITVFLTAFLLLLFAVTGAFLFSSINQIQRESRLERILQRFRSKFRNALGTCSLFMQELYKSLIQQKRILFLLFLMVYFISLIKAACSPQYYGTSEDAAYAYYTEKMQGILTEEQELFLSRESVRLQNLRKQIAELESAATEDNNWQLPGIQSELDLYEEGYQTVRMQLDLLQMKASDGKTHWFLNVRRYKDILNSPADYILSFAVAAISVMMILSGLYSLDARTGMETIIGASEKGSKRILYARVLILTSVVLLAWLCISVPEYIRLYRIDQFNCFSATFYDFVPHYFSDNISIRTVVFWSFTLRFILLLLVGGGTLILTRCFKNEIVPVVLLGGTILLVSAFCMLLSLDLTTIILRLFGIALS